MKKTKRKFVIVFRFICAIILTFYYPVTLSFALPEGESVQSGNFSFNQQGNVLNINQATGKGIINWNSFSIASPEAVNFFQSGAAAIALNRVVGANPSDIFGALTANGQIWLINPNGILFGRDSRVDVSGLLASTSGISNENFLNGRYIFDSPGSGSIINNGILNAANGGYIALLSNTIDNNGIITASLGKVVLAGGEKFTVDLYGNNLLSVVVDEGTTQNIADKADQILNTGTITADGGTVLITARQVTGIFDNAVNQAGLIRANSLIEHDGVIELITDNGIIINTGTIDVSAAEAGVDGGYIYKEGNRVGQFGEVHADAIDGDGGKIEIWASDVVAIGSDSLTLPTRALMVMAVKLLCFHQKRLYLDRMLK